MTAHEFAAQLLKGENLEIKVPIVDREGYTGEVTDPVADKVESLDTEGNQSTILVISYLRPEEKSAIITP